MGLSMRCVVAFLCAVLGSAASNSELASQMSHLEPTELCEYSLKLIEEHIKGMTVPDQQHSLDILLSLLTVPYKLSGIVGQEGSCSNCAVSINPDSVMEMSFTNCNFKFIGIWAVGDGEGPCTASVSDLSINIAIENKDDKENTSFELLSCSCSGGDLKGQLSGAHSDKYQQFSSMVCDDLQGAMYSQACVATREVIEGLGGQLTSTQVNP